MSTQLNITLTAIVGLAAMILAVYCFASDRYILGAINAGLSLINIYRVLKYQQ